ncbi:3-hydroxybenzoate 6-hydroxylase 1 [Venturia nashicola]|uniref:3-hydroxybenzoate 6-hydroxylase 1 n=1 Tax=Venturia nashicola TaxID=86259 RepID=A0A4Z1NL45_9PEZI|nr:3-hydroxybenzoate 6-hydroxylase 1 [Venturia nashicola]TLD20855.1 3-hydroxybenzoate 6-hydroxylase 1 [Venturia nashicola]
MLDIAIIGGGIAGLSAAISLRRNGHTITVYEKSRFLSEIGAAITVPPNALRELLRLGLDLERAQATPKLQSRLAHGTTLAPKVSESFRDCREHFGAEWHAFHRVDLHEELRGLAQREGVNIILGTEIVRLDCEGGTLTTTDGTVIAKDLIVLSNGLHCKMLQQIVGEPVPPLKDTGSSTYRGLVPMEDVLRHPRLGEWWKNQDPGFYNFQVPEKKLILVTYPARNNKLLNVVFVRRSDNMDRPRETDDWNQDASKQALLDAMEDFHPGVVELVELLEEVKFFRTYTRDTLKRIQRGKVVVIGDAAHPMLPVLAQGAAQAIEDAAALGVIFPESSTVQSISKRLNIYEKARLGRGMATQLVSNSWWTMPRKELEDKARELDERIGSRLPPPDVELLSFEMRRLFQGFDASEDAKKVLDASGGFETTAGSDRGIEVRSGKPFARL